MAERHLGVYLTHRGFDAASPVIVLPQSNKTYTICSCVYSCSLHMHGMHLLYPCTSNEKGKGFSFNYALLQCMNT